jgi:hypothetical protein
VWTYSTGDGNGRYQTLARKLLDESAHATLFYNALVGTVVLPPALPWGVAS